MRFFKILNYILAICMISLIIVVLIASLYTNFPIEVQIVSVQCGVDSCKDKDAVAIAYQLGRLDFVSALLACVSIILVISGVFAFIGIKRECRRIAFESMQEFRDSEARKIIKNEVESITPSIYREFLLSKGNLTRVEPKEQDWGSNLDD